MKQYIRIKVLESYILPCRAKQSTTLPLTDCYLTSWQLRYIIIHVVQCVALIAPMPNIDTAAAIISVVQYALIGGIFPSNALTKRHFSLLCGIADTGEHLRSRRTIAAYVWSLVFEAAAQFCTATSSKHGL